jgi:2OG-Fe(II) oxygenase superfamily
MTASDLIAALPAIAPAVLRVTPCLRVERFLPGEVAGDLHLELRDGLEYERVELGSLTRQWRAARPVGDAYFGPMLRKPGWVTPPTVQAALALFASHSFVEWLSLAAGEELAFLRPVTAYRLGRGDRICLHDDMSDPDHAVSVAFNLSARWQPEAGGATIFGDVASVTPTETPWDCPIELKNWEIVNERRFIPEFNSLLLMRLSREFAHGVEEVTGDQPRFSLVGIYGRAGMSPEWADVCRSRYDYEVRDR